MLLRSGAAAPIQYLLHALYIRQAAAKNATNMLTSAELFIFALAELRPKLSRSGLALPLLTELNTKPTPMQTLSERTPSSWFIVRSLTPDRAYLAYRTTSATSRSHAFESTSY